MALPANLLLLVFFMPGLINYGIDEFYKALLAIYN